MKIELSQSEATEIVKDAIMKRLGDLATGRYVTAVEFKSYPDTHVLVTMKRVGEGED